jgi:putative hemolysin
MMHRIVTLAIMGCALVACQTTGPAAPNTLPGAAAQLGDQATLNSAQLAATLTGSRARVDTVSNSHTNVHFAADGTLTGTMDGGGGDDGTWTIKDGRACNTWKVWRDAAERCFRYVSLGGNRYAGYAEDGALELVLTVQP